MTVDFLGDTQGAQFSRQGGSCAANTGSDGADRCGSFIVAD